MNRDSLLSRRDFVASTSLAGAVLIGGTGLGAETTPRAQRGQTRPTMPPSERGQTRPTMPETGQGQPHPPTPAENLTAQHGAVGRLLLVYEEAAKQINAGQEVSPKAIQNAANVIRTAVIELHAPLEEQYIYPRLEQSAQHGEMVKTLREQHAAMKEINIMLLSMTKGGSIEDPKQAAQIMDAFRRMTAAHVAREHSVVFPEFRQMLPPGQYMELGRQFEEKQNSMLGPNGFAQVLTQVQSIESELGLRDLSQFTARIQRTPVAAAGPAQETPTPQP